MVSSLVFNLIGLRPFASTSVGYFSEASMPRSASVFEGGTVEGEGLVVGEDDIASGR